MENQYIERGGGMDGLKRGPWTICRYKRGDILGVFFGRGVNTPMYTMHILPLF